MLTKKHNIFLVTFRAVNQNVLNNRAMLCRLCAIALIFIFSAKVNAAEVTLAWSASKVSNLSGYNLYYRQCAVNENCTVSTVAKSSLKAWQIKNGDLANASTPTYKVYNLSDIHKYSFVLTAYTSSGQESGFSNEVKYTPPNTSTATNTDTSSNTSGSSGQSSTPVNQAPKVDAGKDQSIDISIGKAIVSGSAVDDGLPKNSVITYAWSQSKGPGTAKFDHPSEATTAVSFSQVGTYTLMLTAKDGALAASDYITINVSTAASGGSGNSASAGAQTVIIDNSDTGKTSLQGSWSVSAGATPHAGNSIYGYAKNGAAFTWHFVCPSTGTYDVAAWWTYHSTRSTVVPISIESQKGIEIITVDQQKNSGTWNSLGKYEFIAGESYDVTITAAEAGSKTTCADAVKFSYATANQGQAVPSTEELIIDNQDSQHTVFTGNWPASGGGQPYAGNAVYGKNGVTFTWKFVSPSSGVHTVSMWWSYHSTRSGAAPVAIKSDSGLKQITVNQKENAGKWVSLGAYKFTAGKNYEVKLTATQGSETVCADAVRISLK